MKAIEIWGSNEVREARRYIRECFPDYSKGEDLTGEKMELKIQNGEQIKRGYLKVRELSSEERDYFEKIAVTADRVGFMLFELKNLPKRFKRAYLDWLYDTFYSIWNKIAPHVNREREARRFVPYFEKLAYLGYYVSLRENRNNKIVLLDPKKMEEALQEYKNLWN
ncbi:MAG: hypothetical protein QXQ94_09570 [Candidatus Bathyarchaeia archaeon]